MAPHVALGWHEQGDPDGIPVILLHGVSDSRRSFDKILPLLPDSLRVIALTQRGHGDSSKPSGGYRFADFAADVAGLVDHLRLGKALVVGHSMGSLVAQAFALAYPERTAGLVLAGAFARISDQPAVREMWETVVSTMSDPVDPAFVRDFQLSTVAGGLAPAFLDLVVSESLKVPARVWREAWSGFLQGDFRDDLFRIKAPTLVLWGDRDAFCPASDQELFVKELDDVRLEVYEGKGHCPHWEDPARFAGDVAAFAHRLSRRALRSFHTAPIPL